MNHDARGRRLCAVVALLLATTLPLSAQEPKLLRTFAGHTDAVMTVALSRDGKLLASGSSDKTVKLWDVATGKELYTLKGHSGKVGHVAFSGDGNWLGSVCLGREVRVWNVSTGEQKAKFEGHAMALSHDGKLLASAYKDVKLWDVTTSKVNLTCKGGDEGVSCVALSGDGKWLAGSVAEGSVFVAGYGYSPVFKVKLWDVATGKEMAALKMGTGATFRADSVAFSGDGKLLASAASEGLKLWDVATGKDKKNAINLEKPNRASVNRVGQMALSGDGKTLAFTTSMASVRLWDIPSDKKKNVIELFAQLGSWSVALSGDGSLLAYASGKTVELFDIPPTKKADK
jgi:WD40 repeat protein